MCGILKKQGFTLIELLAVTALIALLAGVTLLRYARMGTQTILTNQARQIYLAAKYARVAAIEQQKPFVLQLDESERQITVGPMPQEEQALASGQEPEPTAAVLPSPSSPESGTAPEPTIVKNAYVQPITLNEKLLVEQFLVEGQNLSRAECVFYPDGTAQACVIQLGDGIRHASVFITQTGRTQMRMEIAAQIQTGRVDLDIKE
ncbi:MAG: prepilin-type N-terminal cleavage/methylation domain-containing protein [Planctomycetes bacterium]|nr:prepilin-type N-terminal cleavage/methylation domain-containing protein [Planctomycetota bacterium]